MFQLDPKWRETEETLFQKSISTENKRLRERYPALSLIASGKPIQSVARQIHRRRQTVSDRKIRACLPGYHIDAIRDNAPYHQGTIMKEMQKETHIHVHQVPSYSPKMNAAEQGIRWAKETLSYNICWETLTTLIRSFNGFVASMAQRTSEILSRCVSHTFGFTCC